MSIFKQLIYFNLNRTKEYWNFQILKGKPKTFLRVGIIN